MEVVVMIGMRGQDKHYSRLVERWTQGYLVAQGAVNVALIQREICLGYEQQNDINCYCNVCVLSFQFNDPYLTVSVHQVHQSML